MLKESDLKIDFYRAQPRVNTDANACRIVHLPTGIEVRADGAKSRVYNKRMAMTLLRIELDKRGRGER